MRAWTFIGLAGILLVGCTKTVTKKETVRDRTELLVKAVGDFTSSDWSNVSPEEAVVSTVNGVKISREELERQMKAYPMRSAAELLDRLVEMEVLAQTAAKAGKGLESEPVARRHKALARAYLREVFERQVTPESVPDSMVLQTYQERKYKWWRDHDEIRVIQVMETCCDSREGMEGCTTEEDMACFREAKPRIDSYYEELKKRLSGTPHRVTDFQRVLGDYRAEIDAENPYFMYQAFTVKYDATIPHEENQARFELFDRDVVEALYRVDSYELTEPVQSKFGWHLLVKLEHHRARHLEVTDPVVVREIQQGLFTWYQQREFAKRLEELRRAYSVKYSEEGLAILDGLGGGQQSVN